MSAYECPFQEISLSIDFDMSNSQNCRFLEIFRKVNTFKEGHLKRF